MPSYFTLCIVALVALALMGLPIGLSMICASIFYLLIAGLDLGTASEQILNGLFNSYVLLAVPLFILAADLMNSGSLTDRLLKFCLRPGGALSRRPRPRQCRSQHHLCRHVGLGHCGCGRHRPHHHRHDDAKRQISDRVRSGDHGFGRHYRTHHPTIHTDGDLCARLRHFDWVSFSRRRNAGASARAGVHGHEYDHCEAQKLSRRAARTDARNSAHHAGRVSGIDVARGFALRYLWWGDDAHGRRGSCGGLCVAGLGAHLSVDQSQATLWSACYPVPRQPRR